MAPRRDRVDHGNHDEQPHARTARSTSSDFLSRADVLATTGHTVLISDFFEYYRLAAYLFRYTSRRIGLAMGAMNLRELFDEKYYATARRRHPRKLRPAVQERPEALRLSVPRPARRASSSRSTTSSVPAVAAAALRLPRRAPLHRAAHGHQHEYLHIYSPDVLGKIGREQHGVGSDGAARGCAGDQARRLFGYG